MKQDSLSKLVVAALFAALVCIATMVIQLRVTPTGGYVNLGDCIVLLCAWLLPPSYGMAAAGVGSMMADVIQYDTITTGVNQEGIFSAAKSFITKLGTSLAIMIVPSLTVIGAAAGENIGRLGLKLTAVAGGLFCLGAIIAFLRYNEREVLGVIRAHRAGRKEGN